MKKILLTGVNGQVGHALKTTLAQYEVVALSRAALDLTNSDAIRQVMREIKPDLVINPAAYTAVDKAETDAALAFAINETAPQVLAEEAAKLGAVMIHFSTDYVYDGKKNTAYAEDDATNPLGVYAKSKLAGEDAIRNVGLPHLILRTSWVYGAYGKNFLKTILRLASEREKLTIVGDQFGAPTSSDSIANGVLDLIEKWQPVDENQSGTYHFTNAGMTSWHGFSCEIVNEYNNVALLRGWPTLKTHIENIEAITTADYPTPAVRPANSCLNNHKILNRFGVALPSWQQGLQQVMQALEV